MNKKEYDNIFKFATFLQLIQILFWSSKKRYYFDMLLHRGYSFYCAFTEVNKKSKKDINDFFKGKTINQ